MASVLTLGAVTAAYATTVFTPLADAPEPAVQETVEVLPPPPAFEFDHPVPGHQVNSPFGLRRMPWERSGRLHAGVDIAAPRGTPVAVAADGVITKAGSSPSYGRYVEIRHGEGLVSLYAHLGGIETGARAGVAVKRGATIGRIGSSGASTGPHLHFEIRQDDRPLNPISFIGRQFATVEDLPLKAAAQYPKRVRIAQVSNIPESKRALMNGARKTEGGRVTATLDVAG